MIDVRSYKANQRINYYEMADFMMKYNQKYDNAWNSPTIEAIVVFSQDNFKQACTFTERSYCVNNHNRGYEYGKLGSCVVMDSLDGSDLGVRYDWCRWKVEYCYFKQDVSLED